VRCFIGLIYVQVDVRIQLSAVGMELFMELSVEDTAKCAPRDLVGGAAELPPRE
jgi:hypothetical protein